VTTLSDDLHDVHATRARLSLAVAVAVTIPGVVVRLTHPDLPHSLEALIFGVAIVGAAFMLSWGAEVAQLDISAGLAIAILALIAVLPEYAVDFVFASKGGHSFLQTGPRCLPLSGGTESPCSLALANMTGANRLLIGVGWSMVVFIAFYRMRKRGTLGKGARWEGVKLDREHSIEIGFLALATIYSLSLPLKHSVTLWDAGILVAIFIAYTLRVSRAPSEEPHLVGPARYLGTFTTARRRLATIGIGVFAAGIIVLVADRFADSLVRTGADLGISEFLLVQWLAPLASEAPELLVAGLYAWRLNSNSALGTLVSSKVNQWTLLVGTLPIVFAVTSHSLHGLPLDAVQREELFLTAAQSFFALAVITSLSMSLREAAFVFVLFFTQFVLGGVIPSSMHAYERVGVGAVYIALGLWTFARERHLIGPLLHDGFLAPYAALNEADPGSASSG